MFNFSLFKNADEAAPPADPTAKIDSLVQQMGAGQEAPAAGGDAISEIPPPDEPAAGAAASAPAPPSPPPTDPVKELGNRLRGMLAADEGEDEAEDEELEEESDAHVEEGGEVADLES